MKRIFCFIRQTFYTIFSYVYFITHALLLTIHGFFLITLGGATDKHKRQFHKALQKKAHFVTNHVPGTTFTYSNPSGETFDTPSVIISNHQSVLDLMGIMMLTPNLIILTKNWVWHSPYYGAIIRYADFFPVDDVDDMVERISGMIAKGYSVMVFPEGTRSSHCKIQRFHRGAFYISEKLNLDIVPVFIKGFGEVLPKKTHFLRPGHMSLEVMDRICRKDLSENDDFRVMTRKVHQLYLDKEKSSL